MLIKLLYIVYASLHVFALVYCHYELCRFELEDVSAQSKVKSSTQRAIKRKVSEQYEPLEPYLDDIVPKGALQEARCRDKLNIYIVDGEALFFQHRNGPIFPTLKLLHKCKICTNL